MFSYFCTKFHQIFVIQSSLVDTKMTILRVWTCWRSIRYCRNPLSPPFKYGGVGPVRESGVGPVRESQMRICPEGVIHSKHCLAPVQCHLLSMSKCAWSYDASVEFHIVVELVAWYIYTTPPRRSKINSSMISYILLLESDGVVIPSQISHVKPLEFRVQEDTATLSFVVFFPTFLSCHLHTKEGVPLTTWAALLGFKCALQLRPLSSMSL